jgi:hypothetical protein
MEKTAYKLANSQVGLLDGEIRLGNEPISLDRGRSMVQSFFGYSPKDPLGVALKLNEAKGYFKQLLSDYHRERN